MEGPRGLRWDELPSVKRLTNLCFWEGLVDKYPHLFNEDNVENLRVITENGEVISHIGVTQQQLSVFGCLLRVACVGAVCTHPDYRNRGLATSILKDVFEKAYADGVDFMMVSGGRGLYLRADCRVIVGCDYEVHVGPAEASLLGDTGLTVRRCGEDDLEEFSSLYRPEPLRFLRRLEDYQRAFACGFVMDGLSDFLMVEKEGSPRAYVILPPRNSEGKGRVRIGEYAGERSSIVGVLGSIIKLYGLEDLTVRILGYDAYMKNLMEEKGLHPESSSSICTLRIINFVQLMERMHPYFEEKIGYRKADRLSFHEKNGAFIIRYGSDDFTMPSRAEAIKIIFGSKDTPIERFTTNGELGALLKGMLPIPVPWYGINYV